MDSLMILTRDEDCVSSSFSQAYDFSSRVLNLLEIHKSLCAHFFCQGLSLSSCVNHYRPHSHSGGELYTLNADAATTTWTYVNSYLALVALNPYPSQAPATTLGAGEDLPGKQAQSPGLMPEALSEVYIVEPEHMTGPAI